MQKVTLRSAARCTTTWSETSVDALLLLGAAVAVLLIVCVNLSALLVSNGEARRREFAV